MTETPAVYPVHTSDRIAFKNCRQAWDLTSTVRQGWRPKKTPKPLAFGTAVHKGMETLYEPETWNAYVQGEQWVLELAVQSFRKEWKYQKDKWLKLTGRESLDGEDKVEYEDGLALGEGMLRNYYQWARPRDIKKYRPVRVEVDFEVPLSLPDGTPLYHPDGRRCVYRGRIDVLMEDLEHGGYWIWDHKTAGKFDDIEAFLELDEQCGSYAWALQAELHIFIRGVVYNELYKGFPQAPQVLSRPYKGRMISTNKQQDTTYELMVEAIKQEGEPLELYEDYLNFLKVEGKQYFRRTVVHRNQHELRNQGLRIVQEVLDQIDPGLRIYPNPNRFRCKWCSVRTACLVIQEGNDPTYILNQDFVRVKDHYGTIEQPT